MPIKIKAKVDRSKLKRVLEQKQRLLHHNIAYVIRNEAVPYLISLIMNGYDRLSDRMDLLPEDPTNPANWREEFLDLLESDFEDNFFFQDNKIIIRMGDRDVLGYGGNPANDDTPVHWLVFYLQGLLGEWAFISPESYQTLTGSRYKPHWGRFGEGFMVSRQEYQRKGWHRKIAFEELRHPFSGFSPLDIFKEAIDEFSLRPFIARALEATADGRRL